MPIPLGALDGLSDDLVLRLFLRAPFETHGKLQVVSRRLKTLLRSREFLKQREDSGLAEYGLVVAGGVRHGTGSIADCAVFTCGRWRSITPLSGPRMTACSAIVEDEDGQPEMWVMGGVDGGNVVLATVEAYNPRTNTWRSCLPLSQRRQCAVAGVVGGRLVVAGGFGGPDVGNLTSVEAYTPTGWIRLPPLPHIATAATACVLNGRLYVMSGGACDKLQVLETSEEHGFSWTVKADLSHRSYGAASAVYEGKAWFIGDRALGVYAPANDTWAAGPPLPRLHKLVHNNFEPAITATAILDGELCVVTSYGILTLRNGRWVAVSTRRSTAFPTCASLLLG